MLAERPSVGEIWTMPTSVIVPFSTVASTWIWPYERPRSVICSTVPVAVPLALAPVVASPVVVD